MANDYGAAQSIADVGKNLYDKVTGLLGDPSKPANEKPDPMKSIPDDNPNKQAWQKATTFTAKTAPVGKKTVKKAAKQVSVKVKPAPRKR